MELLEILRYLNKENINNEPKLRDELFKRLMICEENVSDYVSVLSDAYHDEFRKQYADSIVINYHLSEIFCNEIERQLTDNMMEVDKNSIRIPAKSSAYAVTYVGSIKGMKKLIEQAPQHFDFFKQKLLMGLITRYCKDITKNVENKEKLNELVGIYIEHIRHLAPSKKIPQIIDQEFIDELKKMPYVDSKSCWLSVHRLIDRVYPRKIESSYYQDEFDDKIYKTKNGKK